MLLLGLAFPVPVTISMYDIYWVPVAPWWGRPGEASTGLGGALTKSWGPPGHLGGLGDPEAL